MFALTGELISGCAVGAEWIGKGEIDDYGYIVVDLFILRLVFSY